MATMKTITHAAAEIGRSAKVLRDWERLGLIRPSRTSSGQRVFTDADIEHARAIALRAEWRLPTKAQQP